MAAHARRVIREAVVTILKDARTAAGVRVFDHPDRDRTTFPSLVVEDFGANHSEGNVTESQEFVDMAGAIERRYRFCVIAEEQKTSNGAAARDDLLAQVETAIAAAVAAGDITGVKTIEPKAYVAADANSGEQEIRRGLQVFEAHYFTPAGDPTTTL